MIFRHVGDIIIVKKFEAAGWVKNSQDEKEEEDAEGDFGCENIFHQPASPVNIRLTVQGVISQY